MSSLRFCLTLPEFFKVPQEQMTVEVGPRTGLTYFLHKGRVLAIAKRSKR